MKAVALIALVVACGSDASHSVDAPVAHDAAIDGGPDAAVDAPVDAGSGAAFGFIEVAQGTSDGSGATEIDARFGVDPFLGRVVGSDGPCTLYGPRDMSTYSAGTLTITGTTPTITLDPHGTAPDVAYWHTHVPDPAFSAGATITFTAAGGPDVGAFTAMVTAPATLTGYTPPATISRSGYTVTWTTGGGPTIWVILTTNSESSNAVICSVDDTGSFTVPASTFALLSANATGGGVGVGRVSATTQMVGGTAVTVQTASFITGLVSIVN